MKLTLLCNAGLALEAEDQILLIDLPNEKFEPFYSLPEDTWNRIMQREAPYDRVVGFYFTHIHPDHCDPKLVQAYHAKWPSIPIFIPDRYPASGRLRMGIFRLRYARMDHAPIEDPPCHVVTMVRAGESSLYIPADAKLDCAAHRAFLGGEKPKAAIWNSMYTSRADTRMLMEETASRNYIYHMPQDPMDPFGLWKKLNHNIERFSSELQTVTILDHYPMQIEI